MLSITSVNKNSVLRAAVFTLVVLFCAAYTLLTRTNQVETAVESELHF